MDKLSTAILLLILTLVAHLVEEIKTGFRKKLPVGEMPLPLFVGINVLIYAFCLATLFLSLNGNALTIPLSWAFAIAMLMNGLGHIGMTFIRRRYFPGTVSAFVLLPAAGYLMVLLVGDGITN